MQEYRRRRVPGGTYFFTLVTHGRSPFLTTPLARRLLHDAIETCRERYPFEIEALVLMPEHLHCLWRLPKGASDYSIRWNIIKRTFTRGWLEQGRAEGVVSAARERRGERGVWQRRFWEHTIRNDEDYWRHASYIHWNPVKHGLTKCPHEWPYSTLDRWVKDGRMPADWLCQCKAPVVEGPDFDDLGACE